MHGRKPWEGSTRKARNPPGWERLRQFVLYRDPVCRICGQAPSTEVDHIEPNDDHSLENLQGVCVPCHRVKTLGEATEARQRKGPKWPE